MPAAPACWRCRIEALPERGGLARQRDAQREARAFAELTFHPDDAAVAPDDLARDVESQSHPFAARPVTLRELFEQAIANLLAHPRTGVGDVDAQKGQVFGRRFQG